MAYAARRRPVSTRKSQTAPRSFFQKLGVAAPKDEGVVLETWGKLRVFATDME